MKKTSEAVKKSRAKAGVKPTSIGLTDDEKAEIDALAKALGMTRKAAIMEAVTARAFRLRIGWSDPDRAPEMTKEQLIAEITRRLK